MSVNIIIIIIVFLKIYQFIIESIGMRENIVKNIFFPPSELSFQRFQD